MMALIWFELLQMNPLKEIGNHLFDIKTFFHFSKLEIRVEQKI